MNIKKFRLASMIALALGFGVNVAQAQTYSSFPEGAGPYFRVGVGSSFFENGQLTDFGGPASSRVEYRPGLATEAAIGYAFNKYLATDFELGIVGAQINNVTGFTSHNSYLYNFPFLANVILSYPIPHSIVTPTSALVLAVPMLSLTRTTLATVPQQSPAMKTIRYSRGRLLRGCVSS